jgi:hypothetical protein
MKVHASDSFSDKVVTNEMQLDIPGKGSTFMKTTAEAFALLGYYVAQFGNLSQTFRDNLLVPSSRVKQLKQSSWTAQPLKMGPTGCPRMSVTNY